MNIAVCALTFRRPDGLARLLEGLAQQQFTTVEPDFSINIVDNDPEGSGEKTCDAWRDRLRWPLNYVIEPRRGIAFARNAALDAGRGTTWRVFIDDDEVPNPDWLDQLIRVQREYDADVVGGPVIPHLPDDTPEWIGRGGFFNRRRHPTGQRLPHAFTNNVLFRSSILDELNLRFNERWALMGCEDRAFFQTIGMAGYRIIWADQAIVTEWIPPTRATAEWLIQRHYRVGNTTAFVELDLRPAWKMRPLLLAKSAVWALIGLGLQVAGPFGDEILRLRGKRASAYARGLLTGVRGIPFEEYRTTHSV